MKNGNAAEMHKEHNEIVAKLHKKGNNLHSKHNERVVEFHKNHAAKIEAGENGNGLLARWERFVYNKGKALFKVAK